MYPYRPFRKIPCKNSGFSQSARSFPMCAAFRRRKLRLCLANRYIRWFCGNEPHSHRTLLPTRCSAGGSAYRTNQNTPAALSESFITASAIFVERARAVFGTERVGIGTARYPSLPCNWFFAAHFLTGTKTPHAATQHWDGNSPVFCNAILTFRLAHCWYLLQIEYNRSGSIQQLRNPAVVFRVEWAVFAQRSSMTSDKYLIYFQIFLCVFFIYCQSNKKANARDVPDVSTTECIFGRGFCSVLKYFHLVK